MKKISIYCFILISLGFIGCTSKTHEKTIEDFDIREMSLQVDTLYSRMTQAERVAQLYGIRPKEIMEDGKLLLEKCREKIPDGIGHICQYACALDMEPNELRDFVRDLQNYLIHETPSGIPAIFHEEAITGLAAKGATVYPQQLGKNGTNGRSHALCWRYSCFVTHGRSHTYRSLATYRRILW